jgi:hypothetical protein
MVLSIGMHRYGESNLRNKAVVRADESGFE